MLYNDNNYQTRAVTEKRQLDQSDPEVLKNPVYTPGFLREQIGKLMRVEFLIGTNNLQDRVGYLQEVGASYILLRSIQDNNVLFCDIYSIKFVTIIENAGPFDPNFIA